MRKLTLFIALAALPLRAQEPGPAFEVVAIKPTPPGVRGMGMSVLPGGSAREMPIYALLLTKNGIRLAISEPDVQPQMMMGRGTMDGKRAKTSDIARMLSDLPGRTVVDQTGLTAEYTFTLKWTPDTGEVMTPRGLPTEPKEAPPQVGDGPSIFTALREQAGLKLEGRKGPVEVLVIDSVHKPTDN